ncbi:unnamed protein product [Darwinula stevensoni]|uniref:ADAM 17-like protease n=1 Tax=Darwinula stevensoni TaxID=69355 RepID=A0A7R9AGF7_9CRUS|nr:unnamed protein product [Darwinula stevensoni]CAG0904299.1 unnamed protein product [Darwinula stevensoni]
MSPLFLPSIASFISPPTWFPPSSALPFSKPARVAKMRISAFYCLVFLCCVVGKDRHPNLKYFEVLRKEDLSHEIVKRGTDERGSHPFNKIKEVSFDAMGRRFRLVLSPRRGILDPYFQAVTVKANGKESSVPVDHEEFYEGRVFGETSSHVSAHIGHGLLTASIETSGEMYHVEPTWRHLPNTPRDDSMLIYKESDVKYSWEQPDAPSKAYCAHVKENVTSEDEEEEELERVKREGEEEGYSFQLRKTRCPLLLVADYRFFREMGAGDTKTTINYLISLIDRVHKIYAKTEWVDSPNQKGFKGMGFVIKKILVHSEPTPVNPGELHYNMHRGSWDVRSLLEVFSRQYTHKNFCLAHLFTDIKFDGGILGLAYVGSPRRNSVGGICTPEYFKNGYTLYLNSGLSSSRNHYGQRVITREADLVTAHEFGHNWGSEHDPDLPECSPKASEGGSYLMYTYSVSGYDYNNKKFSPCSLRSIRAVLLAKSEKCFTEPEESFCGNLRVEKGEECDAGLVGTEDVDACCDSKCKLRRKEGAVCSDKNSPCCKNCRYMPKGVKCREEQLATCEQEAKCSGESAECPPSLPLPDHTPCIEKGKCLEGKCEPFCESQRPPLQSCMCDILENACRRCCRTHLNDTCFPVDPADVLHDGTPCMVGYCKDGICEKTMQDIVERFWDVIEYIDINSVLRFLRDNIVGAVILVATVVWIPSCYIISYVDRKRRIRLERQIQWLATDRLLHPANETKVINLRNRRVKPYLVDPNSLPPSSTAI